MEVALKKKKKNGFSYMEVAHLGRSGGNFGDLVLCFLSCPKKLNPFTCRPIFDFVLLLFKLVYFSSQALYDHLMDFLEDRGVDNNFADELVELSTALEHQEYITFLEDLKGFVKSQ